MHLDQLPSSTSSLNVARFHLIDLECVFTSLERGQAPIVRSTLRAACGYWGLTPFQLAQWRTNLHEHAGKKVLVERLQITIVENLELVAAAFTLGSQPLDCRCMAVSKQASSAWLEMLGKPSSNDVIKANPGS